MNKNIGIVVIGAGLLVGCGNANSIVNENSLETIKEIDVKNPQETADIIETTEKITEPIVTEEEITTEEIVILDNVQKNSVAMLNYLAILSQEINSSKNSRMYLEKVYAVLINNIMPDKVTDRTESHLSELLDTIEDYRMISVKRDRLKYLYEQNKARAIRAAIPNPISELGSVMSMDWKKFVNSCLYMAMDSFTSYQAYNEEIEQNFLQEGWELDDDQAENLHENRQRSFLYMIDIVREEQLPGDLALNEKSVEDFVSWKNKENVYQKIQFFESEKSTYRMFGPYWLTLIDCYYENGDYEKCLEAVNEYEKLNIRIFRKDYELAQIIPKIIVAAREKYLDYDYENIANKYLNILIEHTENSDWSLRYFAAQTYVDMAKQYKNTEYIDKAYDIILNNVNCLIEEQKNINKIYLEEIQDVKAAENASKDEINSIKDYNKELRDRRKIELPTVYEPLTVNLDMLFALAEEKNLSAEEKNRIDNILHGDKTPLFLTEYINNSFMYSPVYSDSFTAEFDKDNLIIPVKYVDKNTSIKVTVTKGDEVNTYTDWVIDEVERPDDDFDNFKVIYCSENAEDQDWDEDTTAKVEIINENYNSHTYYLYFKVSNYSDNWILPDTVEFEQV